MTEEKKQQRQKDASEKRPDTETGKDATEERVTKEEESGGALPQRRSDEN